MVPWWNLFQGTIVVVAFGGIDRRILETPNGTNVRLIKQWTGNMVEVDNDRGFVGKISSRVKPKSSQRPSGSNKTFLKIEKVFQV